MPKVDADKIKQINELYYQYHNYAQVSREIGVSPSTVKKYVINGYQPVNENQIKRFTGKLLEPDWTQFQVENWSPFLILSDTEKEEIKELWKEMEI